MKNRRSLLILVSVMLCLFFLPGAVFFASGAELRENPQAEQKIYSTATAEEEFDGSSVIVVMDKKTGGINKSHKESFFGDFKKEYIKDLTAMAGDFRNNPLLNQDDFRQILEIKLPENDKENVLNVIRQLEKIDGVQSASPNYLGYPQAVRPDDPYYKDGIFTGSEIKYFHNQWGLDRINAPSAWEITTGLRRVRVGIMDTGIANHTDLSANIVPGWNFVDNNSNTDDTHGHGTMAAGIVGAIGNNGIGIAGVCWNISLVPLKVAEISNVGRAGMSALISNTISAISYAINHDIPIINYSYGYYDKDGIDLIGLKNAIMNYTGLFVNPSCNEKLDLEIVPMYPASFKCANQIIVGGTDRDDTCYSESCYGANTVHLFAPGAGLVSTYPESKCIDGFIGGPHVSYGYHTNSATSYAAPYVTGAAALILSKYPELSTANLKASILESVERVQPLNGLCITGGILNIAGALQKAAQKASSVSIETYDFYAKTGVAISGGGTDEFKFIFETSGGTIQLSGSNNINAAIYYSNGSYAGSVRGGEIIEFYANPCTENKIIITNSGSGTETVKLAFFNSTYSVEIAGGYYNTLDFDFMGNDRPPIYGLRFYASSSGSKIFNFTCLNLSYVYSYPCIYITEAGAYGGTFYVDGADSFSLNLTGGKWYFITFYNSAGEWNLSIW